VSVAVVGYSVLIFSSPMSRLEWCRQELSTLVLASLLLYNTLTTTKEGCVEYLQPFPETTNRPDKGIDQNE